MALGLIGLPIFTTGGGFAYVLQPTFGFLLGLIPTAAVIGALTRAQCLSGAGGAGLRGGTGGAVRRGRALYGADPQRLHGQGHERVRASVGGMLPFLPGDAIKIAVTALLCPLLRKRIPGLG